MKLRIILFLMLVMPTTVDWLAPSSAHAVAGECSNCHIMHDSQRGVAVSNGAAVGTGLATLLKSTCLGCHTGTNSSGSTPYVYTALGSVAANANIAGGDFYYADAAGTAANPTAPFTPSKRKGHNPLELGANGTDLQTPPGWKSGIPDIDGNTVDGGAGWTGTGLLSCSGVYGCHGKHAAGSMTGAHHANLNVGADGEATGLAATPGTGFRFLEGIKGWEDDKYEFNITSPVADGDHNIYFSENRASDELSSTRTMSYFCAECHGVFHSGAAAVDTEGTANASFASPWIRHPVDVGMDSDVMDAEHSGYTTYRADAPVGSSDVTNANMALLATTTDPTDRIVMCLSCHRAHASLYDAALRWDNSKMIAGAGGAASGTGCFACHTAKD